MAQKQKKPVVRVWNVPGLFMKMIFNEQNAQVTAEMAVKSGNAKHVEYVLTHALVNLDYHTLLEYAATGGKLTVYRTVLANCTVEGPYMYALLKTTAQFGTLAMVKHLLSVFKKKKLEMMECHYDGLVKGAALSGGTEVLTWAAEQYGDKVIHFENLKTTVLEGEVEACRFIAAALKARKVAVPLYVLSMQPKFNEMVIAQTLLEVLGDTWKDEELAYLTGTRVKQAVKWYWGLRSLPAA